LDNSGAGSDVIGDITFERYVPALGGGFYATWLPLGNYVVGATRGDWNTSFGSDFHMVFKYDETHSTNYSESSGGANHWTLESSDATVLDDSHFGYYVYTLPTSNPTITATGGYNATQQQFNLTRSTAVNQGGGWHLLTNPFPSPISGSEFLSDNSARIANYYMLNNTTGTVITDQNGAPATIDVGQSFWVLVSAAGDVTFEVDQITSGSNSFLRDADPAIQGTVGLQISQEDGKSGQTFVRFHEEATPSYEYGIDIYYKHSTNADNPEVWSVVDGDFELLFNSMGTIESTETVPFIVKSGSSGTVSLGLDPMYPIPSGVCVLIEDLETGNIAALGGEPMVIEMEPYTTVEDRFQLTFMNTPVFESSVSHCGGGVIHFNGEESGLWNINWSTLSGDLDGTGCASGLEAGDYVLEAINDFSLCQVHSTLNVPEVCLGDFNLNGGRDITDLLILLVGLQPIEAGGVDGFSITDCDCDGAMTTSDLLLFLPYFGTGCN
jgi:hypothetical protein